MELAGNIFSISFLAIRDTNELQSCHVGSAVPNAYQKTVALFKIHTHHCGEKFR